MICGRWLIAMRHMIDDPATMRARLDRLSYLAHRTLTTPPENRARVERTIQLVCRALQLVAWVRQRTGNAEHAEEAAQIAALCRRIVEQARAAGLRIGDKDS
jgi:hypothetical protein